MSQPSKLPLAGLVVLDLTQIYNGPYATLLMAMAGATVIKIEPPLGEHLRRRNRSVGVTEPFAVLNANKACMTLNLRNAAGRQIFLRLVEVSDVVVENYAPGVMDRLGLGEAKLREINQRLIFASGSGYGSTGPYRDFPAMDLTVQAMSGVMSITGAPDGPPLKAGPAISDFFGGIHLYGAITTALYQREKSGIGSAVEVSMMSSVYPSLLSSIGLHKKGDTGIKRTGNRHGGLTMAPYNVYPTKDGQIAILCVSEEHWYSIARVLERMEWLQDERFADRTARMHHMDDVDDAIAEVTRTYTKTSLFDKLVAARIPCAPVRELDEVINDEHLHSTGMLQWIDHPTYGRILVHGSPLVFKERTPPPYRPSGMLGEHSRSVLEEYLNIDRAEFDSLAEQGAFS